MSTDFTKMLQDIIFTDELLQIQYLIKNGANLSAVMPMHDAEKFLEKCSKDVAKYLSYFIPDEGHTDNELATVVNDLEWGVFDQRAYAKRYAVSNTVEKMHVWSIGLTEREATSKQFLESLNIICDIAPWEDRFMNVDLERTNEVMVSSLQYLGNHKAHLSDYDLLPMIDVMSPNISHILKIRRIYQADLEKFLGEQAWAGTEQLLGISPVDKQTLFRRDEKLIDFRIFDRMKEEVSRVHRALYPNC